MSTTFLAIWLSAGIVCFFLARGAWGLSFGCAPIRIKTLLGMLFVMWVPPISLLAAVSWAGIWLLERESNPESRASRFMNFEIANPCKWRGRAQKRDART